MINHPINAGDPTAAFRPLSVELMALEPQQIEQARHVSQVAATEAERWQIYLNALALAGFEQWLAERSTLSLDRQSCSLFQPGYASLIPAVCSVQVGAFRLCLVAIEGDPEQIDLPRAVIELPEWMAHFYVVVEVWEELQMVRIWGFMRHDQLMEWQPTQQVNSDWTISFPLAAFERQTDHLALHLRCLDPSALPLPQVADRAVALAAIQPTLIPRLAQWQPTQTPLWHVLPWEQASLLLTCPELVNWLAQPQSPANEQRLSDGFHLFTQPAINVGRWLRQELDRVAQTLNWVLLPPLSALRTSTEPASLIVTQLERIGIQVPAEACSGYQDLNWAELRLRLYGVAWRQTSAELTPEWSLVIVLAAQPEHHLPSGLQLRISDLSNVLVERTLTEFIPDAHLYARVVGSWSEKFLVTLIYNSQSLTLPPFAFEP
jgi:hypothetical protein